jgi:hypothetical protein
VPRHTDSCIKDAARYGFCDHTRLTARPDRVRSHDLALLLDYQATNITGWIALALLTLSQLLMILLAPWWLAFIVTPLQALGWSGLFTCGLPTPLTSDPARRLPPDVRERLRPQRR